MNTPQDDLEAQRQAIIERIVDNLEAKRDAQRNLYKEAAAWGKNKAWADNDDDISPDVTERALYWTAWYAGRQAAIALLDEARRAGVTDEQYEALRAKAAEVAYD